MRIIQSNYIFIRWHYKFLRSLFPQVFRIHDMDPDPDPQIHASD
jgi:hypothetical protein